MLHGPRMAEISTRTYTDDAPVETDGHVFRDCQFESVSFRFHGGELPVFQDCTFGDVGWYFTGSALRTIQLLQQIHAGDESGVFIANLFAKGNFIGE